MSVRKSGEVWCDGCGSHHCAAYYCGLCMQKAHEDIARLEAEVRRLTALLPKTAPEVLSITWGKMPGRLGAEEEL